jgi:two-component system, LytTR family, sensor kinase
MASLTLPRPQGRFSDFPLAVKSILGFWFFYFATVMLRALVIGHGINEMLLRRSAGILVGVALTFLVYLALRLIANRASLTRMITVAAIASVPAALLYSAFNFNAFFLYEPLVQRQAQQREVRRVILPGGQTMQVNARELLLREAPRTIADGAVTWYFFFGAWASFYVAMSAGNQLRLAERRASDAERAAQSAQLRALRYQVNPHFLFNTLNSLSSLIMTRREDEAEKMILSLSNFFRSTLTIDPAADVPLADEIRFQMLYLDIEKARFPNRLRVDIEIPPALRNVRIPALLLQPVIENAIKYGVARAKNVVTLTIRGSEEEGRVKLMIENDADMIDKVKAEHGTGVGLANVRDRLFARFGDAARCSYGPVEGGGFRVVLTMPVVRND